MPAVLVLRRKWREGYPQLVLPSSPPCRLTDSVGHPSENRATWIAQSVGCSPNNRRYALPALPASRGSGGRLERWPTWNLNSKAATHPTTNAPDRRSPGRPLVARPVSRLAAWMILELPRGRSAGLPADPGL